MRIGAFRQEGQSVLAMGNHSDGIPERGRFIGRSNQTGAGNYCLTGVSFPQFQVFCVRSCIVCVRLSDFRTYMRKDTRRSCAITCVWRAAMRAE